MQLSRADVSGSEGVEAEFVACVVVCLGRVEVSDFGGLVVLRVVEGLDFGLFSHQWFWVFNDLGHISVAKSSNMLAFGTVFTHCIPQIPIAA